MELAVLVVLMGSAVAGWFVGRRRKQELAGLILGMTLGPVGVGILWWMVTRPRSPVADPRHRMPRRKRQMGR